eukprot:scaffold662995_cov59-Prasinocladus_malaysianus.AAC.1
MSWTLEVSLAKYVSTSLTQEVFQLPVSSFRLLTACERALVREGLVVISSQPRQNKHGRRDLCRASAMQKASALRCICPATLVVEIPAAQKGANAGG